MEHLITDAWQLYQASEDKNFVVRPSIPILFFGDSERYFRSALKIITVGLNPSRLEFPYPNSFSRFPDAACIYPAILTGSFQDQYIRALNRYFSDNPYKNWFSSFEPLLNGMNCSYYNRMGNTALHTDLCSPLATDPTWSRLSVEQRNQLEFDGVKLWHSLVGYLRPDIVIISIARKHLSNLQFSQVTDWTTVHSIPRKRPYIIQSQRVRLDDRKNTNIVFGQAAQKPFGTISVEDKKMIGDTIRRHLYGN